MQSRKFDSPIMPVVSPGLEPGTYGLENRCSIRLSYETNILWYIKNISFTLILSGGSGIRTRGTLVRYGSLANYWFKPLTQPTFF